MRAFGSECTLVIAPGESFIQKARPPLQPCIRGFFLSCQSLSISSASFSYFGSAGIALHFLFVVHGTFWPRDHSDSWGRRRQCFCHETSLVDVGNTVGLPVWSSNGPLQALTRCQSSGIGRWRKSFLGLNRRKLELNAFRTNAAFSHKQMCFWVFLIWWKHPGFFRPRMK